MKDGIVIAFLGTGLIGRPMAARLLQCGYTLVAYNRTKDRVEALRRAGAAVAATPGEAIRASNCVITMLADEPAIRGTLLSNAARQELRDRTVIQMGTISSLESLSLQKDVNAVGGDYLEAPVLGSIPQVEAAELTVLVGAEPEQYRRWSGLLASFGPEVHLIGQVGKAAALKLALNQLIASLTAAFSLSLGMVLGSGLEVEPFMEIVRKSAVYAPTFDKKLPRMLAADYSNPNFPTRLMLKDVKLIREEALSLGLNVAALEGVRAIIERAIEKGMADVDYSALYEGVVTGKESRDLSSPEA